MNLPGKVTISRTTSSVGPDTIRIEIVDQGSGISFVNAIMSLEDFARAVTGYGWQPAELEVRGLERVGMILETKTEQVPYDGPYFKPETLELAPQIAEALKPFEVDGWKGDKSDLVNPHKGTRSNVYKRRTQSVNFRRWVPRQEGGTL